MNKVISLAVIVLCLVVLPAHGQNVEQGKTGYKLCASCHGFKAEGMQLVNAPRLSGLEDWYLERQINNFRTKIRGASSEDTHGQQMTQMVAALTSDQQVADLVAYIATLPKEKAESTIAGDSERGKALYTTCAACHGPAAAGLKAMNAPGLAALDDWYQVAQLNKFRTGQRGADSRDIHGQQMVPMARLLADDQAIRDVTAYINSLQQ